jgi:3-oxoisoapionate kinase
MTAERGTAPLIGFYGDDFTGSTDALEILALAGLDPILVTDLEHAASLPDLRNSRAVGIAGLSRSRSPQWMRQHLPAYFNFLNALGVEICHYKVCSTFDSAPHIGSIGCAIEVGREVYGERSVPVVVGVPDLGRYQIFGNLFARAGAEIFRIDRHPTMKRHPVTPMAEADLRVHLAQQTSLPIGLLDVVQLATDDPKQIFRTKIAEENGILFLDVADDETSTRIGELLWEALPRPAFVAGSSGVEYALTRYWRKAGLLADGTELAKPEPVDQVIVVSGSCSPATAAQIAHATGQGFASFRLDTDRILDPHVSAYLDELAQDVVEVISLGHSVVIYSAAGPADPHLAEFATSLNSRGLSVESGNEALGSALADVLRRVLPETSCRRVVVAGGDTSGRIVSRLGVTSLRVRAPMVRGAPLCVATALEPWADGLELILKGGQVGGADFFEAACAGGYAPGQANTSGSRERRKG